MSIAACPTSGSFYLYVCWRASNEANRSAARVNELNRPFAGPDLSSNILCDSNFCHDQLLSFRDSTRNWVCSSLRPLVPQQTRGMANQALEQTRDTVLRYGESSAASCST